MASRTPTKTKAAPKKTAALPLNKKVNFKSPMVLAVIGLFVALGTFFILKTFAAANPYSCPSPSLPMSQGATGECVKYLQYTLNTYVYKRDVTGGVDGQFGPKTKAAVQGYQFASNTPPADGTVRADLWSKLVALNGGGGGGGFDPQAVVYYYNSPGIAHSYGDWNYDNQIKAWQIRIGDFHNSPGKAWFGPYRTMKVPSGAHGIRACMVYLGLASGTFRFDMTANNGKTILASTNLNMDSSNTHASSCIDYNAAAGTTLSGIEARVGNFTADHIYSNLETVSIDYTLLTFY